MTWRSIKTGSGLQNLVAEFSDADEIMIWHCSKLGLLTAMLAKKNMTEKEKRKKRNEYCKN